MGALHFYPVGPILGPEFESRLLWKLPKYPCLYFDGLDSPRLIAVVISMMLYCTHLSKHASLFIISEVCITVWEFVLFVLYLAYTLIKTISRPTVTKEQPGLEF